MILKSRMAEIESATQAQTLEGVLADFMLLYRAAESEAVEDIRKGLGALADKLQDQRKESLDRAASVGRLAEDLQVRLQEETEKTEA
jgi:hypothetical protein